MNGKILFGAVLCISSSVLYVTYSKFYTDSIGTFGTYLIWYVLFVPGTFSLVHGLEEEKLTMWHVQFAAGVASLVKGLAEKKRSKEHDEFMKRASFERTTKEEWNNDGNEFFALENYGEAVKSYDKAMEMDPEYVSAWVNRGSVLFKLRNYNGAIAAYNEAIRIQPQSAYAWHHKGLAQEKMVQYADAADAFSMAKELGYTG